MRKNVRWITETAVMLALLIALQALTKPLGQLVTGSCVNAVLAVSVLLAARSPASDTSRLLPFPIKKKSVLVLFAVLITCISSSEDATLT